MPSFTPTTNPLNPLARRDYSRTTIVSQFQPNATPEENDARKELKSFRISLAMLLGPASVILFIMGLVLWQIVGDGPDRVLSVYREYLFFGTKVWLVSSVVGLLFGIRAKYLAVASHGVPLVSLHLVSLLLVTLAIADWRSGHKQDAAKELITGDELQTWAINFIAQYPANTRFTVAQLGTNFPRQLLKLDREEPFIYIEPSNAYSPAHVWIKWPYCGFEVGPTNTVSQHMPYTSEWQPGVYFWVYHK